MVIKEEAIQYQVKVMLQHKIYGTSMILDFSTLKIKIPIKAVVWNLSYVVEVLPCYLNIPFWTENKSIRVQIPRYKADPFCQAGVFKAVLVIYLAVNARWQP